MKPANTSQRFFSATRMMVIAGDEISHRRAGDLSSLLQKGDLLIVNAASTLPASFHGTIERSGESLEIRLATFRGKGPGDLRSWSAVAFGSGTWREATERRGPTPELLPNDTIAISTHLKAVVREVKGRLLQIEFMAENLVSELFRHGRPIQYSYHRENLEIWDQQTLFQGPPLAVEPPSASFPLSWDLVFALKSKGVQIFPIVHSAGISSTGDVELDKLLPLSEFYSVPERTWEAIQQSRGRIVALGTSVTRALESAATSGQLTGLTSLKLDEHSQVRAVDVLITGMHEAGTSHAELMKAFCSDSVLREAAAQAEQMGYRSHEYGDLTWIARTA